MRKTYQNRKIDTPDSPELTVPEHVNIVMAEVAADLREGLLALAVGAGLQVMSAMMEADVTALAGPRSTTGPDRGAARPRARVGHPRRAQGPGRAASGPRGRRLGRAGGAGV